MKRTWRRLLIVTIAGIAVFAGFSIYADISEIRDRLAGFGWWAFGAALALATGNYAVRYVRWSLYLRTRKLEVPAKISALTFLSGLALSVTPGKIGELIKSFLLRETCGIPIARSAPVVVAERVTDLIALLLLGIAGVAVYGIAQEMVLAGGLIIGSGLLVLSWPRLAHGIINWLSRRGPFKRLGPRLLEFYDGLAELVRPGHLIWSTALGVLAWLCECIGFALVISAFPGTAIPIGLATLIYATTTIAGALSFLPGGLLVTEATMTLFLVQASGGVDQPTAVAATILIRLATLWFAVLVGIIALVIFRQVAPSATTVLDQPDQPDAEPAQPADQ